MNTNRIFSEINVFSSVCRPHLFTTSFICVISIAIVVSTTFSAILGFLVICGYFYGAYVSRALIGRIQALFPEEEASPPLITGGCGVCGNPNCDRQRPTGDHEPWIGLEVPREIDQATQDLLNKILNEFISSWFNKFTRDESFIWEIRERLRFVCCILLRRVLRTDVGQVICERLVPILLRHIDDYVSASDGCRTEADKVATVVSHLGERVHPAARSRKAELEYLRAVSRTLCRIGLSQQELQCRTAHVLLVELLAGWLLLTLSDTLCSPHVINTLIWLAGNANIEKYRMPGPHRVQFLKSFASRPYTKSPSVLRSDLNSILKNLQFHCQFMQYLTQRGVIHLLRFHLDCEDLTRRLNAPDVSNPSAAKQLMEEAWKVYENYLKPGAEDPVPCSPDLGEQFLQVLNRSGEDVTRLKNSRCLSQASEEIFNLLEQKYLPRFYQSELFFKIVCSQVKPETKSNVKSQVKKGSEPLVSKLSQKLQRLVSGQQNDISGLLVETGCEAGAALDADEMDLEGEFRFRDMFDWKIEIPVAMTEQTPSTRPYPVFFISSDDGKETWQVKRKYNDFYMLQNKLLEFHKRIAFELPPKKGLFAPRGTDYLEGCRQNFAVYLQRLVQQSELRYSDLIHCFLCSPDEFQIALRSPMSFYGLLMRSVEPMKLRKERGRYLESFFCNLVSSIESQPKSELLDHLLVPTGSGGRDITKSIFQNNLAPLLELTSKWPPMPAKPLLRLSSFWDCLLYTMGRLLGCSTWLQKLVLVVKSSVGSSGSCYIHSSINHEINTLLLPRLPHLIRLLQSAILGRTKMESIEPSQLRQQVVQLLTNPPHQLSYRLLRLLSPNWKDGIAGALEALQHPALNKHVFYCLFDEALQTLFPEFSAPAVEKH